MRCEHWRMLDTGRTVECTQRATVRATCFDGEEGWTGALCAGHLAAYRADPEIQVTEVEPC